MWGGLSNYCTITCQGVFDNLEVELVEAPLSPKPQHDTTGAQMCKLHVATMHSWLVYAMPVSSTTQTNV